MSEEKRAIDYEVIFERSVDMLRASVKAQMALGWEPLGGVVGYTAVDARGKPGLQLLQAMVRRQ